MGDWIAAATVCLLLVLESTQGVQLELGGAVLPNNSLVDPSTINETTPLVCRAPCCEEVVWTLPNGTLALDYQIDNTSLAFPSDAEVPSGIYSCTANNDSVYVGIYNSNDSSNNGNLISRNLTFNSSANTLTCISRGGPVTFIVWFRGNTSLNQSDDQSSVIVDQETGTYIHTLTLMDPSSGQYECVVENSLGNASSTLELQLCEESTLRLLGYLADAVLQTCRNNVWYNVVIANSVQGEENQFPLQITTTDTQIMAQWNSTEGSTYKITCTNDTVSIVSIIEEQFVSVSASPSTTYRCCVSILNQSGRIYTEHVESCRTVKTQAETTAAFSLSILEIILIAVGSVLLIVLAVTLLCCCVCTLRSRKKKNKYEVELREQSKHLTKQRIRLMTRPPSETGVALADVGSVLFNRSAHELEESHTFTPTQSRSSLQTSAQDKASKESNPPVSNQAEEATNPMYGQVTVKEDEAENPLYGRVRS